MQEKIPFNLSFPFFVSLTLSLEQNARIMREAEHIEGVTTTTITTECNEIETENVFLAV